MDDKGLAVKEQPVVAVPEGSYDKLFRSSAIGGFNKQDVLNYVERMARNRRWETERYASHIKTVENEKAALQLELKNTQSAIADAQTTHAAALKAMQQEIKDMREKYAVMEADLNAAVSEVKFAQESKEHAIKQAKLQQAELESEKENLDLLLKELNSGKEKAELLAAELKLEQEKSARLSAELNDEKAQNSRITEELESQKIKTMEAEQDSYIKESIDDERQNTERTVESVDLKERGQDVLAARCSALEEKLREYELEKMRMHEIEENAYRRAKRIEAEASEQARKLIEETERSSHALLEGLTELGDKLASAKEETQAELNDCTKRYDALRTTVDVLSEAVRAL